MPSSREKCFGHKHRSKPVTGYINSSKALDYDQEKEIHTMDCKEFLTKHISPGKEFLAGLVSIDIVEHSKLKGAEREKADTKTALARLIESQINNELGTLLPWQGDGGIALFDISSGCDEMVIFADRIRQMLPLFNRTKGMLNKLSDNQEIIVRIACHAGMLINKDGNAGALSGNALNLLAKRDREIGRPGYIVLSSEIYRRLSLEMQDRCQFVKEHSHFGKTYVLDGKLALGLIKYNDRRSIELRDWIVAACSHRRYNHLFYFAYTNELLYDFLGYELSGLEVKILARNWVIEREDEERFNKTSQMSEEVRAAKINRPWFKSSVIQLRAREIVEGSRDMDKSIDMRFYDTPPLFNGAILVGDSGASSAFIGISRWEECPEKGGSQYKLEEWPAIVLDGRDHIHTCLIGYLRSRFQQMWKSGLTYEQVCEQDEQRKIMDASVVERIWKLDKHPYLIVYPQRRIPERAFPVVAHEDVMAFYLVERFLNEYGVEVELLKFQLPNEFEGDWFPQEAQKEIEKWPGHVVYVCTKSLPLTLKTSLLERGFPYEIGGIGTESPNIRHCSKTELILESPTDKEPPEPRDYSIIAKFKRQGKNSTAYVAAGIRAMGTWGAADFLTSRTNVQMLSHLVGDNQFAAIVETKFDPKKYLVTDSKLYIMPEEF
jgi:hypothetical protein